MRLIAAGAGHAHLYLLSRLDTLTAGGCEVTVVNPSRHLYYSGMGPGLLSGRYSPEEVRFDVEALTLRGGGVFVHGAAASVDPNGGTVRLEDGTALAFDVLSCATGSGIRPSFGTEPEGVVPVKPIEGLADARRTLLSIVHEREARVIVAGGGPAGIEIAGSVLALGTGSPGGVHIEIVSRGRVLSPYHPSVRRFALDNLVSRGAAVSEEVSVVEIKDRTARLSDGREEPFDLLFAATGVRSRNIVDRESEDGLPVDRFLRHVHFPNILGGGDCIVFIERPLPKVGVYAVREGPILFRNITNALGGDDPVPFSPQKRYIQILDLGDGTGVLFRGGAPAVAGRWVSRVKELIDRQFIRRFT